MADNPGVALNSQKPSRRRGILPPEIMELIVPPVKIGAYCGAGGAFAGVSVAIAKDTNPVASGIMTGFQWFALGGSFAFARSMAIKSMGGHDNVRPSQLTMASAVGGTAAGAVAGLLRGPARILPAMTLWGIGGAGGQVVWNFISVRERKPKDENDSWLRSKWSPLKKLTDEEYVEMLEDKIMKVEVDIALIDDRIEELRLNHQPPQNTQRDSSNTSTK